VPAEPRELAALADLHLDVVDDGADRHVAERHDVARLDVDMLPAITVSPTARRCGARI
jgi:hypothetical protein